LTLVSFFQPLLAFMQVCSTKEEFAGEIQFGFPDSSASHFLSNQNIVRLDLVHLYCYDSVVLLSFKLKNTNVLSQHLQIN
jgi:hypothetical protein